ncbi:MAG TPA: SpoIIE family protein phosphatase [Candidatus Sulfotelmatobacter sp.]|nr:SpoIIE family protein phosphatase [Candidatus Sulfotelmatobacter sp.]
MSAQSIYLELRRRLVRAELWPEGRVARIACYLAGLAAVLAVLQGVLGLFAHSWGEHLGGWVSFLTIVAAILFSFLAFGWLKRRILWRLRNRLIVTYVFIGVIPVVLLVLLGVLTIYLFAGQFANFVVTSEIQTRLRSLEAANAAVSNELASHLERGTEPTAESLAGLKKRDHAWGHREVCAWYGQRPLPFCAGLPEAGFAFPDFLSRIPYSKNVGEGRPFGEIVRDKQGFYLRAASVLPVRDQKLTVVTSEPLDKDLLTEVAADLGEITLSDVMASQDTSSSQTASHQPEAPQTQSSPSSKPKAEDNEFVLDLQANGTNLKYNIQGTTSSLSVGTLPPPANGLDSEIQFGTPLPVVNWRTGENVSVGAAVHVRTRPSVLYARLFAALGDFAKGVEAILIGVAIFFALIELIALFTGTRMTRTVTRAVAELHTATRHVDRGDFSHRIPVRSRDQLADLALSFNSMTASIEKLILEQKEKQRLENELAIAQEVQAQLFPRQVSELESLEVHGFCRPARTVSGDYYDFVTASSNKLILAVGDISGKGISAALLMATIHSAVRAYSMEGMPQFREPVGLGAVAGSGRLMATWPEGAEASPAALLALLNHQLYESTPPEKYATLFLGIYDGHSHQLTYSNGGHLPPILIGEQGEIRRLETGGTVIGLFDSLNYDEESVHLNPGEIFLAYSDGVTEPENEFGEFGEERLIDLVRENNHLGLAQISQAVTLALDDWIGDKEQPDDVTLVLARAR